MILSDNQIQLLKTIKSKLLRGDISDIAKNAGFTREYVGMVLDPSTDTYNDKIVTEAANVIANREQATKTLLENIMTEKGDE